MKYTSRTQAEALAWQTEVRAKLFRLLKIDDLVTAQTEIPLDTTVLSSETRDGYSLIELEMNATCSRRHKAVLTLPTGVNAAAPAVVCIHGHGGNRRVVYEETSIYKGFAAALAERGFATISADVGQHEVYEEGRLLMGERLWDVMRCVDYLVSRPKVDASRIGCAGLSLGGEMAMWLGAMDERVAATVSSGFLTFMDQMEQNHCLCWKFDGLRELVDYPDLYSLMAPRPVLCQNGLQEGPTQFYVPLARQAMEQIKVIYGDFGKPELATLDVHEGAHEINLPTLLAFVAEHLAAGG